MTSEEETGPAVDVMSALPYEDREGVPLCERALVGALLIDCGMRRYVQDLSPRDFKNGGLGSVFRMIMETEGPIDLVIAVEEAERRGLTRAVGTAGMGVYLSALLDLVPDVENVAAYAKRVRRAAIARRVEDYRVGKAWS